ncbi:hypothetical protein MSG28_002497 [Choristoneura fumiferana]|uniref:Uncharacterized protein n=1 Tax=Choristoneura fumiferana TaxID=7141 RepID=A0ACC0JVQ8_CHOFU|nr:hypothetical protein MSG28_002497 [Choristoneura fumiferana]
MEPMCRHFVIRASAAASNEVGCDLKHRNKRDEQEHHIGSVERPINDFTDTLGVSCVTKIVSGVTEKSYFQQDISRFNRLNLRRMNSAKSGHTELQCRQPFGCKTCQQTDLWADPRVAGIEHIWSIVKVNFDEPPLRLRTRRHVPPARRPAARPAAGPTRCCNKTKHQAEGKCSVGCMQLTGRKFDMAELKLFKVNALKT